MIFHTTTLRNTTLRITTLRITTLRITTLRTTISHPHTIPTQIQQPTPH